MRKGSSLAFSYHISLIPLLESFVHEDFISELDFTTLRRLDKSFITDDFKEKESDLIYSISFRGKPVYIFLLMEFQSRVDKYMALRFLRYICEFYQSLDKRGLGKLPAVFPLLLYNGDSKWTAELRFENLVENSIPDRYIPNFEYFKIAENEFSPEVLIQVGNVVSAVFYVENTGISNLSAELKKLYNMIEGENLELINLFSKWFNNYLGLIKTLDDDFPELSSLKEVPGMFATSLAKHDKEIADRAAERALRMGIEQGIEQGLRRSAEKLKKKGFSPREISELLDLPFEEVNRI